MRGRRRSASRSVWSQNEGSRTPNAGDPPADEDRRQEVSVDLGNPVPHPGFKNPLGACVGQERLVPQRKEADRGRRDQRHPEHGEPAEISNRGRTEGPEVPQKQSLDPVDGREGRFDPGARLNTTVRPKAPGRSIGDLDQGGEGLESPPDPGMGDVKGLGQKGLNVFRGTRLTGIVQQIGKDRLEAFGGELGGPQGRVHSPMEQTEVFGGAHPQGDADQGAPDQLPDERRLDGIGPEGLQPGRGRGSSDLRVPGVPGWRG